MPGTLQVYSQCTSTASIYCASNEAEHMRTAFQSVSTHGEQNMPKLIKHIKCRWTPTLRQNDITLLAPRCLLSRCCWCLSLHTRAAAQNSKKNKDTYVSHVRVELLKYIAGIHIDSKEYLVYSTSWYLFTGTSSTVHVLSLIHI